MSSHKTASTSLARPANTTAYAVGDIVANHISPGSVVVPKLVVSGVPGAGGKVMTILLAKTSASLLNAVFRVHLFTRQPAVASGDNAAMAVAGIAAGYVGHADVTIDKAFSDGAYNDASVALPYQLEPGSRDLYAVIEAIGAYTPASGETFTVRVTVERD